MTVEQGSDSVEAVWPIWRWNGFADLDAGGVHEILALRQKVFIVEQSCIYQDADSYDGISLHLTGRDENGDIVAYARLIPPGLRFIEPSIGRLLTIKERRRAGLATVAMRQAIARSRAEYPGHPIAVSAQLYLKDFYQRLGFIVKGEPYAEDGIVHVDMLLPVK